MQGPKTEMQNTDSTMGYTEEMMGQRKCGERAGARQKRRAQRARRQAEGRERGGEEEGKRRKEKGRERETKRPNFPLLSRPLLDSQRSWGLSVGMGCVRKG